MSDRVVVDDLVPFAHVADVARSIAFYRRLGFEPGHTLEFEGRLGWAFLCCGDAELMVARADEPIDPKQQAVLFYLYARDVAALRARLLAEGVPVGEITHPDHMPLGEIRLEDPDGYCLLVGQLEPEHARGPAPRPPTTWAVWRQDDVGNAFLVSEGHSRRDAEGLVASYQAAGHKQLYWLAPG